MGRDVRRVVCIVIPEEQLRGVDEVGIPSKDGASFHDVRENVVVVPDHAPGGIGQLLVLPLAQLNEALCVTEGREGGVEDGDRDPLLGVGQDLVEVVEDGGRGAVESDMPMDVTERLGIIRWLPRQQAQVLVDRKDATVAGVQQRHHGEI